MTKLTSHSVKKTQRDTNLELYRVIVMMLIVAHHYVVNSGLLGVMNQSAMTANSLFLRCFGAWGKTGINCFMLITGYFMCKSNITLKKYLKLFCTLYFYRFVLYLFFLTTGHERLSVNSVINLLLPIYEVSDGFTDCFFLFYLFIPFINILIRNMNQKQHLQLMCLSLLVYTAIGSVPFMGVRMNYISWFIVLYIIASYIRLYPNKVFDNCAVWGFLTAGCIAASIASVYVMLKLGKMNTCYFFVADSNKILALATAVSSFLFFKNLKIGYSKMINTMGASTFGVLLFHANSDAMRQWLWGDVLHNVDMFNSEYLIVHAIGSVLGVFLIGTCIDMIRIHFVEKPMFARWDDWYTKFSLWYKKDRGNCPKKRD